MSERLARHGKVGAEEVTDAIGTCFEALLEVAYRAGGGLLKFGGDALLLLFTGPEHAERAAGSALGMQTRLADVGRLDTSAGRVVLRMSAGVHTGSFACFLVGESHRELLLAGSAVTTLTDMEGGANAGQVVVSEATAAALPANVVGERQGAGFRLRRVRRPITPDRDRTVAPTIRDVDLTRYVPTAIRSHLLSGGEDPEHRQATVAFLHFDGTDELLEREGPEYVAEALHELVADAQAAADEHQVTFLGTDIDHDGGKIILVAGVPRAMGEDEERMLGAVRQYRRRQPPSRRPHRRAPRPDLRRRRRAPLPPDVHGHGRHREPRGPPDGPRRARSDPRHERGARPGARVVRDRGARAVLREGQAQPGRGVRGRRGAAPGGERGRGPAARRPRRGDRHVHRSPGGADDRPRPGNRDRRRRGHRQEPADRGAARPAPATSRRSSSRATRTRRPRRTRRSGGSSTICSGLLETAAPEQISERLRALVDEKCPELLPWLPLLGTPLDVDIPDTPDTARARTRVPARARRADHGDLPRPRPAGRGARGARGRALDGRGVVRSPPDHRRQPRVAAGDHLHHPPQPGHRLRRAGPPARPEPAPGAAHPGAGVGRARRRDRGLTAAAARDRDPHRARRRQPAVPRRADAGRVARPAWSTHSPTPSTQ